MYFIYSVVFSLEEAKTLILPELVELTNDEHSRVRLAGLETVVNILSLLDGGSNFVCFTYHVSLCFGVYVNLK